MPEVTPWENRPDERVVFYQSQIKRLKWMIQDLEKNGEKSLHEFDKHLGVPKAMEMLKDQLKYFEDKLKGRQTELEAAKIQVPNKVLNNSDVQVPERVST